ncbi:Fic family protein [candidate division KSB1 bacterium]|nr:Fic family protein [candidate division KSB1 bacterium]
MDKFKAGVYINQGYHKSFQPSFINRKWQLENMEVLQLLSRADREIGRLDMYSEYIPNLDLFIKMHVLKEATQSSKIEGTNTNLEEALLDKEDVPMEKRDDWEEVQNYISAMNKSIERLKALPFSSRLLKEVHKELLQGVRGEHKLPGEYRKSQNWIGGATIDDATFVPPSYETVPELMSDLEKFIHNDSVFLPDLLKIALIHYQFETIHPFLDGNGRVGRLLITLYLVEKKILKQPVLYLSDFFERNRMLYYDNLMRVRQNNDLDQWFKFFLIGVTETAQKSIATFDNIMRLQKYVEDKISTLGSRAAKAQKVINFLYQRPLITASVVGSVTGLTAASSYKLINDLIQLELLREITGGKRGKIFVFEKYLGLFYQ